MFGLMGVARMSGQPGGAWSPLRLFAGGEQGAWYDPSDFASMFQDSAGTTPVTAVEQPVGLILDKRLGTPGQNLFPDPGWTTLGGWEAATNATIAVNAGKLVITSIGAGPTAGYRLTTVVGKQYQFIVTLVADAMNGNTFIGAGPGGGDGWAASFGSVNAGSTPGTYAIIFVATTTDTRLILYGGSAANAAETLQFSTPVIRELPGNHATQATAAARPVVSAPSYINYDGIDDLLATTFPNLGSACTIARAVPMVGASILTGQTIGAGVRNDNTDHAGLVIIDRALTAGETAALTAYLNAKAGV